MPLEIKGLFAKLELDWDADWSTTRGGLDLSEISGASLNEAGSEAWVAALVELGMAKGDNTNGTLEIECPWVEVHSDPARGGTAYLGGGKWKCQHEHCAARKIPDFKAEIEKRLLANGSSLIGLMLGWRTAEEAGLEEAYVAAKAVEHMFDPPPGGGGGGSGSGGPNPDGLGTADLAKVEALNARYAVVGGLEGVLDETMAVDKKRPMMVRRLKEWVVHFGNDRVWIPPTGKGGAVPKPLGGYWLGWPGRRTYAKVDLLEPGTEPAGVLNLWPGLAVTVRAGQWPMFEEYLREVVANGDKKMLEHVIKMLQWWVTHPLEQGYTYLVLYGVSRAGKTKLYELLAHVFGERFSVLIEDSDKVLTGFNDHIAGRLLVGFDEAVFGKDKRVTARVKSFITGDQVAINAKFQTLDSAKNRTKALFFANDLDGVPIDPGDQRATVLEVGRGHVGDEAFYGALTKAWKEGGEAEAFVADALKASFKGWSPRKAADSAIKVDAMIDNARPGSVVRWWFDKLTTGNLHGAGAAAPSGTPGIEVARSWVVDNYEHWATRKERGGGSPVSAHRFWKELQELCPGLDVNSRKSNGERFAGFPSLDDCRSAFEQKMGGGTLIAWDGKSGAQGRAMAGAVAPGATREEGGALN